MSQALLNYFKKYLTADKKIGSASTKNYVSDINLFLNWVSRTLQEENIQAEHLTPTIVKTYQKHLTQNVHPTTAQRHLSSLRRFGEFLVNTNRLTADPTKSLTPLPAQAGLPTTITLEQIVHHYADFLKHENLSNSTIKNYLSDLNQYLSWAEKNHQLTDNNQNKRPSN